MFTLLVACMIAGGCMSQRYDPQRATRPYPRDLHTTETIDIQVFRDGAWLELVNATPRGFEDFDVWVNQRYMYRARSLSPGGRLRLSLWNFFDAGGETPVAGGLWRTDPPTPVRLVQIQPGEGEPLTGLITIRAEPAD